MRLIDADDLLEHKFKSASERMDLSVAYMGGWNDAIDSINENAPTIEAEPVRHGKWIECESENGIHFHKCSECGKRDMYQGTFTDWNGRGFSFYYKRQYCPSCGCKMDKEST